jgi:hypothetical protein
MTPTREMATAELHSQTVRFPADPRKTVAAKAEFKAILQRLALASSLPGEAFEFDEER